MTQQLAREWGVPELEVIRAFPDDRATELAITGWEDIIRRIEALGAVRVCDAAGAGEVERLAAVGPVPAEFVERSEPFPRSPLGKVLKRELVH